MHSTLPETPHASLTSMIGIEARRFAKHPVFILGVLAAYGIEAWVYTAATYTSGGVSHGNDLLSHPIIPAFFIGLTSLIVAARLTRSTEVSVEAMGTMPGTESRRTIAVAGACLVPFAAGVGWLVELLVLSKVTPVHPDELWFGTVNDLYVWSILVALGPVACLGGALLGVLVGRWLTFRGAPAVAVVLLVITCMAGTLPYAYSDQSHLRLWAPWATTHTGTMSDGTAWEGIPGYASAILPGNPAFYLAYLLVLCALAVGGALWHDRTARTTRLRLINQGLIVVGIALFLLAAFTGLDAKLISEPLPMGPSA